MYCSFTCLVIYENKLCYCCNTKTDNKSYGLFCVH